ncbi:MAG: rhodanese-like domain-containing protein [Panacagrimonas sp.]
MQTLNTQEFQSRIADPQVQLLDVRMPEEIAVARLESHITIVLHELPQRWGELDRMRPVAIYCHHGVRSLHAGRFLEQQGFADVCHLDGGIEAWSIEIDPRVARY